MADEKPVVSDILGIKVLGEAALKVVDGAGAFLSKICLPAAEEFGFLIQDRVRHWRASNALAMAVKARDLHEKTLPPSAHAHPRLAVQVIEHASWADEDEMQSLWAGLLVSSCTDDGRDDSNLMFIDLLSKLSAPQARLLEHVGAESPKLCTKAGLVLARRVEVSVADVQRIMRIVDIHRIDRELDHLRALGLIDDESGFIFNAGHGSAINANPEDLMPLGPTGLALQMHARMHGAPNPLVHFGLVPGQGLDVVNGDRDA